MALTTQSKTALAKCAATLLELKALPAFIALPADVQGALLTAVATQWLSAYGPTVVPGDQ